MKDKFTFPEHCTRLVVLGFVFAGGAQCARSFVVLMCMFVISASFGCDIHRFLLRPFSLSFCHLVPSNFCFVVSDFVIGCFFVLLSLVLSLGPWLCCDLGNCYGWEHLFCAFCQLEEGPSPLGGDGQEHAKEEWHMQGVWDWAEGR